MDGAQTHSPLRLTRREQKQQLKVFPNVNNYDEANIQVQLNPNTKQNQNGRC